MEKLTLDTNVLRDWAWAEGRSPDARYRDDPTFRDQLLGQFRTLGLLRDAGICEVGVTNLLHSDLPNDRGVLPPYLQEMIGNHVQYALPSISVLPAILPMILVDKDDVTPILHAVFPGTAEHHAKYKSNRADALHLLAHRRAKRDIFLTSDGAILAARAILGSLFSIQVMALAEYLDSRRHLLGVPPA